MKKIFLLLSMILLLLGFESKAGEPIKEPIPIKKEKTKNDKPNLPGMYVDYIHAYISENVLTIIFDEPEGMAEVLVKDELGEVCAYTVGSTETEITLSAPLNVGVFSLEISTSLGNEYIGYFFGE